MRKSRMIRVDYCLFVGYRPFKHYTIKIEKSYVAEMNKGKVLSTLDI